MKYKNIKWLTYSLGQSKTAPYVFNMQKANKQQKEKKNKKKNFKNTLVRTLILPRYLQITEEESLRLNLTLIVSRDQQFESADRKII